MSVVKISVGLHFPRTSVEGVWCSATRLLTRIALSVLGRSSGVGVGLEVEVEAQEKYFESLTEQNRTAQQPTPYLLAPQKVSRSPVDYARRRYYSRDNGSR